MVKGILILFFLSIFNFQFSFGAPLSQEQEQQFKYYWYAARQAIEEERYKDAFVLLEFCHALNPDDASTVQFLGLMYQAMGQDWKAMDYFEQAYKLAPNDYWRSYLDTRKRQFINEANWEMVLKTQDEIDQHQPYDGYSAYLRYTIYAAQKKYKKAFAALDKYLEKDPENLRFLMLRLELMEQTKTKQKDLYAMYERILELDPYNLSTLNNYAYHLATHKGDLQKAERMSAITIQEEPNNPVYLDTYGWILHMQGQDDLAHFYLGRAWYCAEDERTKEEIIRHVEVVKSRLLKKKDEK